MFADEQSICAANTAQSAGDQPFEYVTLTGNVIRSVVPPGKGAANKYKVNQGYARPFGASPASAAPRSPVSYPPQQQQQQWGQPQQQHQAPRPAVNPYATLPRSNVGQQAASPNHTNNSNFNNATLPRKPLQANHNIDMAGSFTPPQQQAMVEQYSDQATAMLTDSIGKINMGDKMNNFMSEASKIISNMLEARLANNNGAGTLSNSGSSLSLRSNSSSNLSRSPMVMRKRFELDDFKDVDPTVPESLKPVVALNQQVTVTPPNGQRLPNKAAAQTLTKEMSPHHPMGKVLDLCDKRNQLAVTPKATPAPATPPMPAATDAPLNFAQECTNQDNMKPMETVVFRNIGNNKRRAGRGGELSTHAIDRRSYIEPSQPTAATESTQATNENAIFSVSVKPLGRSGANFDENTPMSAENEEVVSQLLKDGKRPICCQCNVEITKGPFITALGHIWCPDHFICVNANCRRPLQDIGFVEEKGDLYCEYCFEKYLAPTCSNCAGKIKGDCLNAIGKHFHPECFTCGHCGKLFGNTPFFLEEGKAYCEADWNELFTTKCFACGFPVEAGDRWVEALNHNYHSQCFNCTFCKQNLEGQSFYNKGGRPFCKNHAR